MSKKNRRPQPRPARPTGAIEPASHRNTGPDTLAPGQLETLIGLIATGALDAHLPQLAIAIRQRQHHLTTGHTIKALAAFAPGDRVRLNHQIRPLYLHGATGTVTGWAGQSIIVQLDAPTGRFTTGEIRCPSLGLEPIRRE
ncbi:MULTISPECIES: hypothetical protein [unclassified Streptomyces]|uniref:hypothetical protein n=1 Tax=unclassified Streptomyces TaxID=2593676 RepID=UPI00226DBBC9|nr:MULTISPECIES: hypothetical protein [unclassified Streptomyces]MCY0922160.1 hypothetical protein [Streptomyces sp. H27-G5]MCY0924176.1 hypothetical protein [Streptomyces sp. H27-G5]MCY0959924.1 hypothetical protein [Streptomyces sp. H27-H5]